MNLIKKIKKRDEINFIIFASCIFFTIIGGGSYFLYNRNRNIRKQVSQTADPRERVRRWPRPHSGEVLQVQGEGEDLQVPLPLQEEEKEEEEYINRIDLIINEINEIIEKKKFKIDDFFKILIEEHIIIINKPTFFYKKPDKTETKETETEETETKETKTVTDNMQPQDNTSILANRID